ncbi:MAG: hypothetical protein U0X20_09690 [Caldilineaceae bacterium]
MTAVDDLLAQIFDQIFNGQQPDLYGEFRSEFGSWVRDSRRFREFALSNRAKIRAKLKSARDEGGLLDVRAELQTALLLLGEERFTLEYEAYAAAKQRGPDYTVTFKTHTPFNVEVRRIRAADLGTAEGRAGENGGVSTPTASSPHTGKLMAVLCDKVGQMPPSIVNLLWLAADGRLADADITSAAAALRQLAERKADDFFVRRGFLNTGDFLKQYGRLSGIVVYQRGETVVWQNGLARHKPPREVVTAIERLART